VSNHFGYEYFDAPYGRGYRGYRRSGNGDDYLPWDAARAFCRAHGIRSALDLGCAKGFLVEALLEEGVRAVGYDVSRYALSFAAHLPCFEHDVRHGIPRVADAVFALGLLVYVDEPELAAVLASIRAATRRFFLFASYYAGDAQAVPDPWRRITRPHVWWKAAITGSGFTFSHRDHAFDVYTT
jgi:SAM-dependent methyltransferase